MVNIVLGCDINTNDEVYQSTVAQVLEQAGHVVEKLNIEPNAFASYSYDSSKAKGKVGIYLIAAGTYSIGDATYGGTFFDYNYFGIRPEASPNWDVDDWDKKPIGSDPDTRGGVTDKIAGHTFAEINEIVKERSMCVTGKNAKEMGQALVDAIAGKGFKGGGTPTSENNGSSSTGGGTAILIPDKTFYGVIKQILGAIDGVFTIANNMAFLLSFKDMHKYRNLFEDHIPKLEASDIVVDGITHYWTTDGLYNAVEVTYADGIIRYQHDALIEVYGESTFYYEFPSDDEETAKDKAKALLSAHIRDYSLDIQINCVYNPNITVGGWIKIPKTLTKISTNTNKEGPIKKLYKAQEKKTRKGVNITNINETAQKIDDKTKTVQHITTEDGKKYDVEVEKKDYEIYFVQSYRFRWTPKSVPIMSLHLKYGPDTPEDPVNATISTGGVQTTPTTTTNTATGNASYGSDCFSICDICIENCAKILPYGSGRRQDAEEYIRKHEAESKYLQGRARQNGTYVKDISGKTPQEAYYIFRDKFDYACYADSCDASYPCCEDLWTKAKATNCADATRMLKVLMDALGVPCYGVHVDGHYFNAVQVSGTWHTLDGTRGPTNSSCGFPDAPNYGCGTNNCGSGCCP